MFSISLTRPHAFCRSGKISKLIVTTLIRVYRNPLFTTQECISVFLGNEKNHCNVATTQIYLDANLAIKEEILAKTTPINVKGGRYRPDDELLAS
jgi:hypothetical protein